MARYACLAVSCGRAQRFEGIDMTQDPRESYYQDFSPPIHIGHRAHLTPKNVPFDHGDTSRGTFPHRRRSGDPMINLTGLLRRSSTTTQMPKRPRSKRLRTSGCSSSTDFRRTAGRR
jgi:hypothetical protein